MDFDVEDDPQPKRVERTKRRKARRRPNAFIETEAGVDGDASDDSDDDSDGDDSMNDFIVPVDVEV